MFDTFTHLERVDRLVLYNRALDSGDAHSPLLFFLRQGEWVFDPEVGRGVTHELIGDEETGYYLGWKLFNDKQDIVCEVNSLFSASRWLNHGAI